MIGKTISHYKIIEEIGSGGMGMVYKAEDTKLKRAIALKFLHPHLSPDKEANERFEREAQASAALNHPNIITVYEINEHEKQTFIAMEYVEGHSLRDEMSKGPMTVDHVILIAKQIAKGLSKAHGAGIIHRDIKPENILIDQDGRVKIVDFGLARMKGVSHLTKDSSTIGTLNYMSPEQFQNDEVDQRTDIWSFGIVLFEMITGQLPFEGNYEAALMYAVLNEEPKELTSLKEDVPTKLVKIIEKSLNKDQNKRFQNINEILKELKKPDKKLTVLTKTENSIIVLPFINMSPDPDQEYFSDGLTEEIISDLSQIRDVLVISRSSAMTFKGTKKKITEIAKDVNVQYVLEGSVRKAGNNLRITAQLIEAAKDMHLWAEKYSGKLDDVFDIQEKVSRSIVEALKLKLIPEEKIRLANRPFDNIQAYECWLKARQAIFDWTEGSLQQASNYLNKGLEIIGENASLYAALGFLNVFYFNSGIKKDPSVLNQAEVYIQKSFQLDPDVFLGHYAIGFSRYLQGNIRKALFYLNKAVAINPNNADVPRMLCYIYCMMIGKPEIAVPFSRKVLEVDPLMPVNYLAPMFIHWTKGDFDKAMESCQTYYQLAPKNIHARFWYATLLAWNKRWDEAATVIEMTRKEHPNHTMTKFLLFFRNAFQNKRKEALQSISDELKNYAWYHDYYSWLLAESFSLINEKSETLKWLKRAIDLGFCNYPLFSELDPFFDNIRRDEEFKKLMERVKYEWDKFEV